MTQLKPHYDYPEADRRLAAACYIFGVPTLYCILTAKRFTRFVGGHATQAFLMWILMLLYWLAVRIGVNLIWWLFGLIGFFFPYLSFLSFGLCFVAWIYAVKYGIRAYKGETFEIDRVRNFGEKFIWKTE